MPRFLRFEGEIRRLPYALAAVVLLLSQHAAVALAFAAVHQPLVPDIWFWLAPQATFARSGLFPSWGVALGVAYALLIAWALAIVSFRRASAAGQGYAFAAFTLVPGFQLVAVALLILIPHLSAEEADDPDRRARAVAVLKGVLIGNSLLLSAVVVSAVLLGTYGWGLFILTPFVLGLITAYLGNRPAPLDLSRTSNMVMGAAGIGSLSLLMFALEGLICILLIAPLAIAFAAVGGLLGRYLAIRRGRSKPLLSVALLPLIFLLEAASPPSVTIRSSETIDIAAPCAEVWRVLTAPDEFRSPPGIPFRLGLAYPIRARILGEGVGAIRLGQFSTGTARERITIWRPGRELAFALLSQPASMEEFGPYGPVETPHLHGYFETAATRFELQPLPGGGTRLTVIARHTLRIDPLLYWEPIARWAVRQNSNRVLRHIRDAAERGA